MHDSLFLAFVVFAYLLILISERGFELPFYADLPSMPEQERRAIWRLMVGEEGVFPTRG
jgi:hypothetical protein